MNSMFAAFAAARQRAIKSGVITPAAAILFATAGAAEAAEAAEAARREQLAEEERRLAERAHARASADEAASLRERRALLDAAKKSAREGLTAATLADGEIRYLNDVEFARALLWCEGYLRGLGLLEGLRGRDLRAAILDEVYSRSLRRAQPEDEAAVEAA